MSPQDQRPLFLRWQVWAVYAALFAAAIPWYWPEEQTAVIFGIPLWVAVTLAGSCAISMFTAWLLLAGWPGDEEEFDTDSR